MSAHLREPWLDYCFPIATAPTTVGVEYAKGNGIAYIIFVLQTGSNSVIRHNRGSDP